MKHKRMAIANLLGCLSDLADDCTDERYEAFKLAYESTDTVYLIYCMELAGCVEKLKDYKEWPA